MRTELLTNADALILIKDQERSIATAWRDRSQLQGAAAALTAADLARIEDSVRGWEQKSIRKSSGDTNLNNGTTLMSEHTEPEGGEARTFSLWEWMILRMLGGNGSARSRSSTSGVNDSTCTGQCRANEREQRDKYATGGHTFWS